MSEVKLSPNASLAYDLYKLSVANYEGTVGQILAETRDLAGVYDLGFVDFTSLERKIDVDPKSKYMHKRIFYPGNFSAIKNFHARLVFPFNNEDGEFLGLIGRAVLKTQKPKYYNTHFSKKLHIFGLDKARDSILLNNYVLIVEGPTDAIRLNKYGIPAVAALGTSVTTAQLCLLNKYTENIFIAFDPDDAGVSGAQRILEKSLRYFPTLQKITLHNRFDPDELITNLGSEFIKAQIFSLFEPEEKKDILEEYLDDLKEDKDEFDLLDTLFDEYLNY